MPTYKCLSLEEFKSVLLGDKEEDGEEIENNNSTKNKLIKKPRKRKVVVIFYLTYCGYSQQMLSLFREQSERPAFVESYDYFVEVDCDEQPDIQHHYGIKMIPHIMVFRDREKVGEVIGKQIFNKAFPAMLSRHMQ